MSAWGGKRKPNSLEMVLAKYTEPHGECVVWVGGTTDCGRRRVDGKVVRYPQVSCPPLVKAKFGLSDNRGPVRVGAWVVAERTGKWPSYVKYTCRNRLCMKHVEAAEVEPTQRDYIHPTTRQVKDLWKQRGREMAEVKRRWTMERIGGMVGVSRQRVEQILKGGRG